MKAKELATILGVSPATISLLLNNKPGLSQALRDRLTAQIIELGYEDMLGGRTRRKRKNSTDAGDLSRPSIVYITCKQEDPWEEIYSFYSGVLEGAQQEAREIECNLMVIYRESEISLQKALKRAGEVLGAIVVCDALNDATIEELERLQIPYVCLDVFDPMRRVNTVNVDNRQSLYQIVDYLKRRGHRDIGYVMSGWNTELDDDRRIAFRRALKDLHLRERADRYFTAGIEKGPVDISVLEEAFSQAENLPTALVAEDDSVALRTVNALKRAGLRVPEDVSVVGFDDNPLSRVVEPRLTTVRNSRHRMGRECVAMIVRLRRLMETDTVRLPMRISLSTEIVERESVCDGPAK